MMETRNRNIDGIKGCLVLLVVVDPRAQAQLPIIVYTVEAAVEEMVDEALEESTSNVVDEQVQEAVATGVTTPSAAARRLLEAFKRN